MPARFHWAVYWAAVGGLVLLIAGGGFVLGRIAEPTPEPIMQTRTLDPLPACRELEADLQAERARADDVAAAAAAVDAELALVDDVFLTRNEDKITAHAEVVDEAMREEQAADQALVTARATLDARIADCAPERDR